MLFLSIQIIHLLAHNDYLQRKPDWNDMIEMMFIIQEIYILFPSILFLHSFKKQNKIASCNVIPKQYRTFYTF